MSAFEFPFAVNIAVKKGGRDLANTGDNIYRRKDKRWEGRFISGRKPDGRAKYTYVYGKTRTETKEKLEKRKLLVTTQPTGSCRMRVKELFSWYLARIDVKPSTRSRYKFQIENHIASDS